MKYLLHPDCRLRGVKGAEEKALSAVRLLCSRGYFVTVHQCLWRGSLDTVHETVLKLQELGVSRYRIMLMPVEASLRWRQTAPDQTLSKKRTKNAGRAGGETAAEPAAAQKLSRRQAACTDWIAAFAPSTTEAVMKNSSVSRISMDCG